MSPKSPGYRAFVTRLCEAFDHNDFPRFEAYAHARSLIPPCPGESLATERKWYGTDSFMACEGCYMDLIESSPLAPQFTIQGTIFADAIICDISSPRMRAIWAQACEMGNPDHFSAAAEYRCGVYIRTTITMRAINNTIDSQSLLSAQLNANAAQMIANAAMSEGFAAVERLISGSNEYRYWNLGAVIGYGITPVEVEAAAMRRRLDAFDSEIMALRQQVCELLQEWMAVE